MHLGLTPQRCNSHMAHSFPTVSLGSGILLMSSAFLHFCNMEWYTHGDPVHSLILLIPAENRSLKGGYRSRF